MSPSLRSTDPAQTNLPSEPLRPETGAVSRAALSLPLLALGALLFLLLATANGAGYRYGTSDQAVYIPVIRRAIDAGLFPRDGSVIDAEGHLMLMDEVMATVVGATGMRLETAFLVGYILSMVLLWAAVGLIGARVYRRPWAVVALGAAVTLRHRIPRTSANSLEPYFNPRMLAFSLGALAVAAVLHRRDRVAIALIAVCAVIHITTALWFALLIGVALALLDPLWRRLGWLALAAAILVLAGSAISGPLEGTLTPMDAVWRQAVASKDSLFATEWPLWAWAANFASLALLWWAYTARTTRGDATPIDRALVWGATALVALFVVTLPLIAAGVALPVQFQISRVFWLVEFVAVVYVIGALADGPKRSMAIAVTAALAAFSAGRGLYIMLVERPERPLFEVNLPQNDWEEAMRWLAAQPADSHVLADPGHAWKYGTSVRVSAERDVLIEEVKDSALAIYSRDVAGRVVDRINGVGNFAELSADRAREIAGRYDLDYLVTENDLPLDEVFRNDQFRIYSLR
jgi:hypothetical protein